MKLFIHFGIYKAGSSYLQYICANRRDELKQKGIWFPFSPDEEKMKTGSISAGNAFELSEWLKHNKKNKIKSYLAAIKKEANKNNCECVLLTAEALVHQFAREDRLKLLEQTALKIGFGKIHAMGYFRDPVDHCISLYKHRSKSGKNPDFEYWVREVYETPRVLNDFFRVHNTVDFNWKLIKFRKDADYMVQSFFEEWLGVKIDNIPDKPAVNESISLSEVRVMQLFAKSYSLAGDVLLRRFINLSRTLKAKDSSNEHFYRVIASGVLNDLYAFDLGSWNKYFPYDDKLEIKHYDQEDTIIPDIELTDNQISQVMEAVKYLHSYKSMWLRLRRWVKNWFFD